MTRATRTSGVLAVLLVASLVAACSEPSSGGTTTTASITVEPEYGLTPLTVNVLLTDDGFEPSTIYLPAGRQIRLVLRNRGTTEHHYLVRGLVPSAMRWIDVPEIDAYDVDSLPAEELAALGIDLSEIRGEAELEHVLHHLNPTYVPYRDAAPSGVKPTGLEVHGWTILGTVDVMSFFALTTGTYQSEDVLFPDITGKVVVFDGGY